MTALSELEKKLEKSKEKSRTFPIMEMLLKRDRTRLVDLYLGRELPEPKVEMTPREKLALEQENSRIEIEKERIKIDKQMLKMAKPKKEPDRPNPFLI